MSQDVKELRASMMVQHAPDIISECAMLVCIHLALVAYKGKFCGGSSAVSITV